MKCDTVKKKKKKQWAISKSILPRPIPLLGITGSTLPAHGMKSPSQHYFPVCAAALLQLRRHTCHQRELGETPGDDAGGDSSSPPAHCSPSRGTHPSTHSPFPSPGTKAGHLPAHPTFYNHPSGPCSDSWFLFLGLW
jgi:hypothetical protein